MFYVCNMFAMDCIDKYKNRAGHSQIELIDATMYRTRTQQKDCSFFLKKSHITSSDCFSLEMLKSIILLENIELWISTFRD